VTGTGSLHLPLLETEHNSPDEIALAASLVFGNGAVVERALKASIIEPGPGTALSKLTPRSVSLLKNVFGRELRTEISVGENTANVSDIGSEAMKAFASMIVFDDGRHPTSTRPRFLRKMELKGSNSYQEFIALKRCSEAFGVYVHPSGFWSEPRAKSRGIEFSYRYQGTPTDIESAALAFIPGPSGVAEVWITNFRGCAFYVPRKHLLLDVRGGVEFDLSNIELLGSRGKSRGRGKATAASQPLDVDDLNLAQQIVARNLAMDVVARAMSLLGSFGQAKVSLEHLAVRAGYDGDILSSLRNGTAELIEERRTHLFPALSKQLLRCTPAPNRNWNIYWQSMNSKDVIEGETVCGYQDEVAAAKACSQLEYEVVGFVEAYARLIDLSYCLVPLQDSQRPSEVVPGKDVFTAAMETLLQSSQDFPVHRITRALTLDERNRFLKARELAAPPAYLSAFCLVVISSVLVWLSHECFRRVIANEILATTLGLFFAASSLGTMMGFMDGPLNVRHDPGSSRAIRVWTTARHLTERLNRGISVWRGLGTPFEREVADLTSACKKQYRIWSLRCCQRDYYKALNRKKIGAAELDGLLMAMAEEKEGGYVEGILPGSLSEGDAFLALEIDTSDSLAMRTGSSTRNDAQGAFASIADMFTAKLTRRVIVNMAAVFDNASGHGNPDQDAGQELVQHTVSMLEGTVVARYGEVLLVRLDDGMPILPVPSQFCTFLTGERDTDDETDDDQLSSDESDIEEIFNEDEARGSLQRARRRQTRSTQQLSGKGQRFKKKVKIKTRGKSNESVVKPILVGDVSGGERTSTTGDEDDVSASADERDSSTHRYQTVRDALKGGGWKLVRMKNHLVYRRKIRVDNNGDRSHQTVTMSKTPSDWRAQQKVLSTLRRLDDEANGSNGESHAESAKKKCMKCHIFKSKAEFSKTQWRKNASKCQNCIQRLAEGVPCV